MLVKSLMTSEVKSCAADTSLAAAARIMSNRDCGIVPVVDVQQKLLGETSRIAMSVWLSRPGSGVPRSFRPATS